MVRTLTLAMYALASLAPEYKAFAAEIRVSACGEVLSAPGKYSLSSDLLACPGFAVTIAASDVSLDLSGNEITCERATGRLDIGVQVSGGSDVYIHNGSISGCDIGLRLTGTQNSKVSDMNISGMLTDEVLSAGGAGIVLQQAIDNQLVRNRSMENTIGIILVSSNNNRITSNTTNDNAAPVDNPFAFGMGIALALTSHDNLVSCNVSERNSDAGIVISTGASNNGVRGNVVRDNLIFGIGAFTRVDLPFPTTQGNVFRKNISLGNGLVDIFEGLFDPLAAPPQSIEEACRNTWKENGYVSELIPALCFSVPVELEDENVCTLEDDD